MIFFAYQNTSNDFIININSNLCESSARWYVYCVEEYANLRSEKYLYEYRAIRNVSISRHLLTIISYTQKRQIEPLGRQSKPIFITIKIIFNIFLFFCRCNVFSSAIIAHLNELHWKYVEVAKLVDDGLVRNRNEKARKPCKGTKTTKLFCVICDLLLWIEFFAEVFIWGSGALTNFHENRKMQYDVELTLLLCTFVFHFSLCWRRHWTVSLLTCET